MRLIIDLQCPESPRWYIKKHRYSDALRSLKRLRNTPLQAARDLYYIHAQVRLEEIMLGDGDIQKIFIESGKEHFSNRGRYFARFVQLFVIARVRRATLAAFVVMMAQQFCGSAFNPPLHIPSVRIYSYHDSQHYGFLLGYSLHRRKGD